MLKIKVEETKTQDKKVSFLYYMLFICICFVSLFFTSNAKAANLSIYPATGNYKTGSTFTASINVSTGQAINGVEGVLSFPTDKLEVIGVSKNKSIMSLWIREPEYSNAGQIGTVNFSAIKLNPGYIGQKGKIVDVIFKVRSAGVAEVNFASGSVLANDGKGTNLLNSLNSAVYSLKQSDITMPYDTGVSVTQKTSTETALPVPFVKIWLQDKNGKDILFNSNEGDPKWSDSPYVKLTWSVPNGVTGVSTKVDEFPNTELPDTSEDIPDFEIIPFLQEGKNYFHIKFINEDGSGPTLHLPLFVDLHEPKNFTVNLVDTSAETGGLFSTSNPQPILSFFTEDNLSGLDRYEAKINDDTWLEVNLESNGTFRLPKLPPEKRHNVIIRAFDLAGNYADSTATIVVQPIVPPSITYFPQNINLSSEPLIIEGISAPKANIELSFEKNKPIIISTKANEDGIWRIVYSNDLPRGVYSASVRQVLDNGAESLFSSPVIIRVNSFMGKFLELLDNINWYIWFIIFIMVEASTLIYYRRKFYIFKNSVDRRLDSLTDSFEGNLKILKNKISLDSSPEQIKREINEIQKRIKKNKNHKKRIKK
jgi:hypothetical protein